MSRDGPSGGSQIFCHKYNIFVRKNLNCESLKRIMKVKLLESFHPLSGLIVHYAAQLFSCCPIILYVIYAYYSCVEGTEMKDTN